MNRHIEEAINKRDLGLSKILHKGGYKYKPTDFVLPAPPKKSVFIRPKDFNDSASYYESRDQFKTNQHLTQISNYNASMKTRVSEFRASFNDNSVYEINNWFELCPKPVPDLALFLQTVL